MGKLVKKTRLETKHNYLYDIEVEDTHNFYANGVLVHNCKSSQSAQGKNLLKLDSEYKVGATGTLILNSPLDAYVPLKWIKAENSNFTVFKNFYCVFESAFSSFITGYKNLDLLKVQIEDNSLRRTKDTLDLPPKTIINEYVDMNDEHRKFYVNLTKGIKEDVDLVNINTNALLSMVTRLRQATACPSILSSNENIKPSKIDRAADLVEQIVSNGEKVVVFSTFKEPVNILSEILKEYNPLIITGDTKEVDSSRFQDMFQQDDEHKVLLGTWQKAGTGLTLNRASYMIFIDVPWTQAVFTQACDRIYRIGTKKPVFIYHLICKDTIDERVLDILNTKEAVSDYIVDDIVSPKSIENLRKYVEDL